MIAKKTVSKRGGNTAAKKAMAAKKARKSASVVAEMMMPAKGGLYAALAVFLVTATLGVVVNSFAFSKGFNLHWSVSRYVGSELWSAILFALGNGVVVAMVMKYLWGLGEAWKMPRVYYYCSFVMAVGLIWLSVCPVGFCDIEGQKSLVSLLHEWSSKLMFIMMMLVAAMLAGSRRASAGTKAMCIAYVVYGIFCVAGYLTNGCWFTPLVLIYETVYIATFPLMLAGCETKRVAELKA